MIVYLVRHLLPVATPPVTDGAVAVDGGRIVAVGRRREVLKAAGPGAEVRDLGDAAVIPGLVNAHTHLELSWIGETPLAREPYVDWIRALVTRRALASEAETARAAEAALVFMSARGTAGVADVANGTATARLLAQSGLRAVIFHEVYGFRVGDAETILDRAAERLDAIESGPEVRAAKQRLAVVLTPHAAHSTSSALLKALGGRAVASNELLSIHVAESEAETQLLRDGTGPMADFLRERDAWEDGWKAPGLSPVEHLDRLGLLTSRTLAVHCVHVDHQDISKLQARQVTVVTCPRSNRELRVGRAPVPRLLSAGIPVVLGTDSSASSPDLDMLAEMAALREEHPGLAPAAVLRMATLNGARALGFERDLGVIDLGREASLLMVPLADPGDDPLETVTWNPPEVYPIEKAPWEAKRA